MAHENEQLSSLNKEEGEGKEEEEQIYNIKRISCRIHLFHKEDCEACLKANESNRQKNLIVRKEKLEAIEKKRKEKEERKLRILAMLPSSTNSEQTSQKNSEKMKTDNRKIEMEGNELDLDNMTSV